MKGIGCFAMAALLWLGSGLTGKLCQARPSSPSLREIKFQYRSARIAEKRKQYLHATRRYARIVAHGKASPRYQRRARYRMAFCLFRSKGYLLGLVYLRQIIRRTRPTFRSALLLRALNGTLRIAQVSRSPSLRPFVFDAYTRLSMPMPAQKDLALALLRPHAKFAKRRWWANFRLQFLVALSELYRGKGPALQKQGARALDALLKAKKRGVMGLYHQGFLQAGVAGKEASSKRAFAAFLKRSKLPATAWHRRHAKLALAALKGPYRRIGGGARLKALLESLPYRRKLKRRQKRTSQALSRLLRGIKKSKSGPRHAFALLQKHSSAQPKTTLWKWLAPLLARHPILANGLKARKRLIQERKMLLKKPKLDATAKKELRTASRRFQVALEAYLGRGFVQMLRRARYALKNLP